jgi:pimeloyl-ACP methyl ester carboxylesterase
MPPVEKDGLSLTSGCTILNLKRQNQEIDRTGIVPVRTMGFPREAPVYVMAFRSGNSSNPVGSEQSKGEGLVLFGLPLGRTYDVLAFEDTNRNRRLDHSEQKAIVRNVKPRPLAETNLSAGILALRPPAGDYGAFFEVQVPTTLGAAIPVGCGEVAKVTDAKFAPKIGSDGLWRPEDALRAGHLGLYFNEPFDPSRTPVVFVHGIGGSPRDFAKLIPALDKKKFQAWFFVYPSGFRLDKAASALAELTSLLMEKHRVGRVHIVAHSMGGLVSRAAILKMNSGEAKFPVDRFVSISTPFGGYEAAESGIRHLKYPVPSWIDMAPDSDFLKALWSKKLPYPTRHWLLFGYDTRNVPWLTLNNDQVVNLRSSLYPPAQNESVKVFGIAKSHEGILFNRETYSKINEFLKSQ